MKQMVCCNATGVVLLCWLCLPATGQDLHNPGFDLLCASSKTYLCHWDLSWGAPDACRADTIDGRTVLRIAGTSERSVGFVEQSVSLEPGSLRIIEAHALIRTSDIVGRGAGLNLGMYDVDGQLVATRDMGGHYGIDWRTGTTGWDTMRLTTVCPAEAVTIKAGVIVYGSGIAWIDDYHVEMTSVGKRMPSAFARQYVQAACDTIARHSLVRDSISL
ncbi:MAG: hypothetical protein R3330_15030, partial [Saprospiraceae bacterium]|nr:hypothetical protein [Saprospiraceae bacterium]